MIQKKAEENAEQLSEKNIFANPFDWRCCLWTGLGLWIAIHGDIKMNNNGRIFLSKDVKNRGEY